MNIQLLTLALGLALVAPVFAEDDAAAKSEGEVRRHSHDITTNDVSGDKANESEILPHDEFATPETPDKVSKEKKHHKKKHHKKKKKAEAHADEHKDGKDAALSADDHKADAPKADDHMDAPKAEEHKDADHKDAAPAEEKK